MRHTHFHSPYAKTLTLILGTLVLLLVTSYLVRSINETYSSDADTWISKKTRVNKSSKQFAALKSITSGVVYGDAHRALNGTIVSIDVAFSGFPVTPNGKAYNLYFGTTGSKEKLFIARFGEPQLTDGQPTYRLTGWGPETWLDYGELYIIEEPITGEPAQRTVIDGSFAEQL